MFNLYVVKYKKSKLLLLLIHFLLQCNHVARRFRHFKIFSSFHSFCFLIISNSSPLFIVYFFLPSPLSSNVLNFYNNSCSVRIYPQRVFLLRFKWDGRYRGRKSALLSFYYYYYCRLLLLLYIYIYIYIYIHIRTCVFV